MSIKTLLELVVYSALESVTMLRRPINYRDIIIIGLPAQSL